MVKAVMPEESLPQGIEGGGHKRLYRKIDFRRNEKDIYGRIVTIEYDPNQNAYICRSYSHTVILSVIQSYCWSYCLSYCHTVCHTVGHTIILSVIRSCENVKIPSHCLSPHIIFNVVFGLPEH